MLRRKSTLLDHVVIDAAMILGLIVIFSVSGPVARYVAAMDEGSIATNINSISVFVGFLVYRRIWALRPQS